MLLTVSDNIKQFTFRACSNGSPPLMRMPFRAPTPVPTIMAVGVASPSEHGQAMDSTVIAYSKALRKMNSHCSTLIPSMGWGRELREKWEGREKKRADRLKMRRIRRHFMVRLSLVEDSNKKPNDKSEKWEDDDAWDEITGDFVRCLLERSLSKKMNKGGGRNRLWTTVLLRRVGQFGRESSPGPREWHGWWADRTGWGSRRWRENLSKCKFERLLTLSVRQIDRHLLTIRKKQRLSNEYKILLFIWHEAS